MLKNTIWMVCFLFFFGLASALADSPREKQRKQNLRELHKKLKFERTRNNLMSKDLTNRRKAITATASITREDLVPRYDAQNKITGYSFSLRKFFEKIIEKKPKIFYYPLQIYAIKLHYQGENVASIGWCGPKLNTGLYSDYKFGKGRYLFTKKRLTYSEGLYIYFETNDKMTTQVSVQYLGIDSISPGGIKHWETDLKMLPPYRETFYKNIPKIGNRKKADSLFVQLTNLLNYIKTKYASSGPQVRRLIEQNYPNPWLSKLKKMLEERNREVERVLESIDELYESNKNKRASFNLNEIIQKEYQLEKELKKALDTSKIENYLKGISKKIQKLEKVK